MIDSDKIIFIVITTELDINKAHQMARLLLLDKLISCVSFKKIESHFWWEGEINESQEVQLMIKCIEKNLNKVCDKISEYHSYDVPEIIYFPVSANKAYHDWVSSL